jgi:hypothetical protein
MTSPGDNRPDFVGLSLGDAEAAARTEHLKTRVFGPTSPLGVVFTAEYAPNRLNLLVRDGIVVDPAIG